ncbi:glycosyltransferase family 2 protein [Scytonema sp. PCC 10023]|uniref:glycosyltransferase family 2 protein n=1 Tax=Scytonema sp. PCC 10023 TaxID=1680591 RepID=UPI0039C5D5AF
MSDFQLKTPIAFIIFRRPHTTERVFEAIRQAKPPKLFVIADGPHADRVGEAEKCEATRAIIERVDWDCEVIKNYSDTNLGCAKCVSSGIDWVFSNVEEAIILEDDCLPHPTFFRFCEELLEKYRYDTRIASISGQNVQFGRRRTNYSYYFSRYNHCWGWASWRRAWQHYDLYIKHWKEIQSKSFLTDILMDPLAVKIWSDIFQSVSENPLGISWAYQWTFTSFVQNRLGIISNVNLISNIGFGSDSTHFTSGKKNPYDSLPTEPIEFPLKHPPFVIRDDRADNFTQSTLYNPGLLQLFKNEIKKMLKGFKKA